MNVMYINDGHNGSGRGIHNGVSSSCCHHSFTGTTTRGCIREVNIVLATC